MRRKPVRHLAHCTTRKRCLTRQDARQDLVKAVNARGSGSTLATIMAAYCCAHCGHWHLTRKLPWCDRENAALHLVASDAEVG